MSAETERLDAARRPETPWKKWGPYLSERQWGTVREDCSSDGASWEAFPHDHARSRAYRWGEDGLGGISDDQQLLCFALALWNGQDPIIKERLFGLTNSEGNHGEDVKEYYFYLDSTPTHSYMKYLYKYPQAAYPYDDIVATNRRRSRQEFEYELLDTGVFDDDRYFDVFVEYAKGGPEDILVKITVHNRGPSRPAWTSCQRSGSAIPGPGPRAAPDPRCSRWMRTGGRLSVPATPTQRTPRPVLPVLRRGCRAAVHRERDEHDAALGHAERQPLREGRHQRLRRPRRGRRREPGRCGDQGRGALSAERRSRPRRPSSAYGSPARRRRSYASRSATSMRSSAIDWTRRISSTTT